MDEFSEKFKLSLVPLFFDIFRYNFSYCLFGEVEFLCKSAVIKAVEQIDLASAIILECRFIKKYSTQRTIEQLASHDITITVGNFYHRQRKALLMAYEFIPKSNTKIVK